MRNLQGTFKDYNANMYQKSSLRYAFPYSKRKLNEKAWKNQNHIDGRPNIDATACIHNHEYKISSQPRLMKLDLGS